MIMRRTIVSAFATLLATASLTLSAYAQSSTAFTYQGFLQDNNNPANGTYDLKFTLYDAATEGNAIGNPVFIEDLQIQNGLFTVEVDFGTAPFAQGQRRWIEIAVRPGDSTDDHTTLDPRIELTPVPYALYAQNVAADAVSADQLANDPNALSKVSGGNLQIIPGGFLKDNSRKVYFHVYVPTSFTVADSSQSNDWYKINFRSTDIKYNTGGGQYSNGEYTVPVSGLYFISFVGTVESAGVYWGGTIDLTADGARLARGDSQRQREGRGEYDQTATLSGVFYLPAGTKISARVYHYGQGRGDTVILGAGRTSFTIYLLSAADEPQ